MKHDALRSAAHNIADSLASECSSYLGYREIKLWDAVDRQPAHSLLFDALTGEAIDAEIDADLRRDLADFSIFVGALLRDQSCNPEDVTTLRIEFRRSSLEPLSRKEVRVTVAQRNGRQSTDIYLGAVLKRPRLVDSRGRIRRQRAPIR